MPDQPTLQTSGPDIAACYSAEAAASVGVRVVVWEMAFSQPASRKRAGPSRPSLRAFRGGEFHGLQPCRKFRGILRRNSSPPGFTGAALTWFGFLA